MGNGREDDLPGDLPGPARRALSGAGYVWLDQLTTVGEADVLRLRGMEPKAVNRLRRALDANGRSFAGGG